MNNKLLWASLALIAQLLVVVSAGAEERFFVSGTSGQEIVLDRATGLVWAKEYAAGKSWSDALSYCETLDYGGYTDWRLPNVNELRSLVDLESYDPASAFPDMPSEWFWSSSSYVSNVRYAWYVYFYRGNVFVNDKAYIYYARCARSGP